MLYLILIIICVVLLIFKYATKNHGYWKKKNIIQVDNLLWTFTFEGRSIPEICKTLYEKYDTPHIGTFQGAQPTLILKNLEDVQAVFTGDFQSFYCRGIDTNPNDILADNLLFMNDFQRWKLIRQKLSPVFTSAKLKNMFYIMEKCARDFVELVENKHKTENPFNMLYTYTTASIGASVFGIDTQTKNTMDSPFLDMAWKSVAPNLKLSLKFFIAGVFPSLYKKLKLTFFGDHEDFFIGAVKSVLRSRKYDTENKTHDFIEICLELQKQGVMQDSTTGFELVPSDELLAAQAFFFFIAGADTSANTMHFTLLELSTNPKVLAKLHKEIDNIFDSGKNEVSYTDIEKLEYLDMVVNEAMRKYPPIGIIQRQCTKDTVLPSNVKIEKGTQIIVPVLGIHRDEQYYSDPDTYDPERFRHENASSINKYAFLPFGEGNRICIGSRFARLQVKAGLAWLLRRFTLAEQSVVSIKFERSTFGLRDPTARYEFVARKIKS